MIYRESRLRYLEQVRKENQAMVKRLTAAQSSSKYSRTALEQEWSQMKLIRENMKRNLTVGHLLPHPLQDLSPSRAGERNIVRLEPIESSISSTAFSDDWYAYRSSPLPSETRMYDKGLNNEPENNAYEQEMLQGEDLPEHNEDSKLIHTTELDIPSREGSIPCTVEVYVSHIEGASRIVLKTIESDGRVSKVEVSQELVDKFLAELDTGSTGGELSSSMIITVLLKLLNFGEGKKLSLL
jgi:hypothetical protein